jgi:histidinol-phosphate aminotransferase
MPERPPLTRLVSALPATIPFVPPEALERQSGKPVRLRLGANESPFGASPKAQAAMREAAARIQHYGDPESYELREALARRLGVTRQQIVVGAGIDDLLGLVVRSFLEPGAPAVTSLGGYPTFSFHVDGFGGALHKVPYRGDKNDLAGLAAEAARVKARLVYLANPDNPTGSWHDPAAVSEMRRALPGDALFVLDEAYVEFAPASPPIDPSDPGVIRLRTFSKVHGMAGARIAYAVAHEDTISAFDKIRLHFGVSSVAQAGALASLDDPEFVSRVVAEVAAGRRDYEALGAALGIPALPSSTNFVAFDAGTNARAKRLLAGLLEAGVFVRMPGAPPLDRLVRITVGSPAEREALAPILRRLVPALDGG